MLETVDLHARLDKSEYKETLDKLDLQLAQLQRDLRTAGIPVMVVFEGWDAAGKGSALSRLLQPLDPRGYKVHTISPPTDEERMFPPMWRFWKRLPARGALALFDRSWYRQVLDERIDDNLDEAACQDAYERIRVFERQFADDGGVIVKFFLHISKKEQRKRFKKLSEDPAFSWKVGKAERRQHKRYDEYAGAVEDMLRETSTPYAPWTLVSATDQRLTGVTVAEALVAAFEQALASAQSEPAREHQPSSRRTSPLDRVDLTLAVPIEEYKTRLPKLQAEVRRLQHLCYVQRKPVVIVYEGWDAAGKGGNIRRLVRDMDPRGYEVVAIGAPEGDEKTHHYLWRFWRALPKAGHLTLFDRSWYGRVMVERIEGFASVGEWTRAYREINEFEAQLVEFGTVVIKFWIHIGKDEQLRRFESRQQTPHKNWKITEEDWRNRERWDDYWHAVSGMIERTSTAQAPWTIVEGNDKYHARLRALQEVVDRLTGALGDKK
ncbi:MAG: polyphosphate:AMP phosphotransferase [Candidatus Hydrogenedentes bacterium]|nr:polyphosphate:AMP phosphotransferase [Candidatus Hydrogenedentota bacterium]